MCFLWWRLLLPMEEVVNFPNLWFSDSSLEGGNVIRCRSLSSFISFSSRGKIFPLSLITCHHLLLVMQRQLLTLWALVYLYSAHHQPREISLISPIIGPLEFSLRQQIWLQSHVDLDLKSNELFINWLLREITYYSIIRWQHSSSEL
jgi:hypothetical protein